MSHARKPFTCFDTVLFRETQLRGTQLRGTQRLATILSCWLAVVLCVGCGGGDAPATTDGSGGGEAGTEAADMSTDPSMTMDAGMGMGGSLDMAAAGGSSSAPADETAMTGTEVDDPTLAGGGEAEAMAADAAAMAESYAGGQYPGGQYPGGQYPGAGYSGGQPGQPAKPQRPEDVATWTREQLLEAVQERDARVPQAIEAQARKSGQDPAFAQLMTEVLATASGQTVSPTGAAATPAGGAITAPGVSSPGLAPSGNAPKPPGGVFIDPQYRTLQPTVPPVDSVEVMLGEALLSFAPQADQATRGAADRIKGEVEGRLFSGDPNNPQSSSVPPQSSASQPPGGTPGTAPPGSSIPPGSSAPGSSAPGTSAPGYPPNYNPGATGAPGYVPPGAADSSMTPEMAGEMYGEAGYGNAGNRAGSLQDRDLVIGIVRGLVISNSPAAWTMLQGIAAGNVPTPLAADEATGIIIGEAFAAETVNTDMAKQLLSSAVANLPEDPQQYATSMRLLTALAQEPTLYFLHLSKPAAPAAAAGQPQPGQPGQPGSYSGAGMSSPGYDPTAAGVNEEAMTSTGEDLAAAYSGGQPGAAAAAAPTMGNMSLPTVRLPQAAMLPVAGVLWSSETAGMLTERLKAAKTLEETTESLALAANTPTQPSRKAIQELFSRLFDKGANGLVSSGVLSAAGDPGMLPILKSLPRRRPAKAPAGGGPPEMTPADTWAMATGEYVLALRDRLRKLAEDTSIPNEPEHRLRLHPDAPQPERSIALIGPDDAARELGEATPVATSVYYTRLVVAPEREIQMKDIVDYYEKRTKGFRREDRARGILWYDGVKKNSDGTLETMDVVIQQAGAAGAAGFAGGGESGGGGQPGAFRFQIEILVVVTKDPAGESETAAVERSRN